MNRKLDELLGRAPLTAAFLAGCIAYFVFLALQNDAYVAAENARGDLFNFNIEVLRAYGASYREAVWAGGWRHLVMPIFMHGGLLHIVFNMWSLYAIGPSVETHFGSANFGTIYLVSGVGGVCFSLVFGGYTSVGASGALFGLLGAGLSVHLIRQWDWRRALKSSDVRQSALVIALLFGITALMDHVDVWGHLGGLVFGTLFGCLFEYWRKHQRIGWVLIALFLAVWAGGIAAARWTVFHPHYQVFCGIEADKRGERHEAEAHFEAARYWSKRFKSRNASLAVLEELKKALQDGDEERIQRYQRLFVYLSAGTDEASYLE
ncbi:MAG: rhomboid family intramembrane serine protease [Planctomycetota bacterium]|nr:rhomboid family intramembrane serine protease [Planctomycetota bacterium]